MRRRRREANNSRTAAQGRALASYWWSAGLVLGLVWIAGLGILGWQAQAERNAGVRSGLEGEARLFAENLSGHVGFYRQLLRHLARHQQVVQALGSGGSDRERHLAALVPGVLRVRLLPPGYDRPHRDEDPPLTFASLDLLHQAEKSADPPPLEIQKLGAAQIFLVGAVSLRDPSGQVVSLLHLTLPGRPLFSKLARLADLPGRIALRQKLADGRLADLTDNGVPVAEGRPADGTLPIRDSRLQVAWWFQPSATTEILWWWGSAALLLLAFMGGTFWFQHRSLRRALLADQAAMARMVEDVLSGQPGQQLPLGIRDLGPMRDVLLQRLANLRPVMAQTAYAKGKAASASPPPEKAGNETKTRPPQPPPAMPQLTDLPEVIFKAYDIRGIVGSTLTPGVVREIGRAIGSQAYVQGEQTLVVARDHRPSSEELAEALMEGILATGRDVVDLGMAPVPLMYFATHHLRGKGGVMVTGSHNPAQYNGLKIVLGGESLSRDALWALRERVIQGDLLEGQGTVHRQDLSGDYIARMAEDVRVARPLKIVLECGGGSVSEVAPALFRGLGCEPLSLHCAAGSLAEPLDPSLPENLSALQTAVREEGADLGFAFDGDGDRLGVVDSQGQIVTSDRLLMLLAADLLARHPGTDVIYDVKCSRALAVQILQHGGRPVMSKSGHSLLKARMKETGALLAGEWSGHIMFRERWYGFDDALYAGARLCEILAVDPRPSAEVFAEFPVPPGTPELFLEVAEGEQYALMDRIRAQAGLLTGAKIITLDGLRAEFEDGWGLVRASNTLSALSFRFEGDTPQAVQRIEGIFATLLEAVDPDLKPPF